MISYVHKTAFLLMKGSPVLKAVCISCFSHCHDKTLHKSNVNEGSVNLGWSLGGWGGGVSHDGGSGEIRERLLTFCGVRKKRVLALLPLLSPFILSETPACRAMLPTARVDFPTSAHSTDLETLWLVLTSTVFSSV